MRVTLVRYSYRSGFGQNQAAEWRRYRLCGIVLTLMNMSLAGVVILVISQNRGFHYGGYLIYIMAMYAFYVTIMAVVNLVRYRKYRSPGHLSVKGCQFGGGACFYAFFRNGDADTV